MALTDPTRARDTNMPFGHVAARDPVSLAAQANKSDMPLPIENIQQDDPFLSWFRGVTGAAAPDTQPSAPVPADGGTVPSEVNSTGTNDEDLRRAVVLMQEELQRLYQGQVAKDREIKTLKSMVSNQVKSSSADVRTLRDLVSIPEDDIPGAGKGAAKGGSWARCQTGDLEMLKLLGHEGAPAQQQTAAAGRVGLTSSSSSQPVIAPRDQEQGQSEGDVDQLKELLARHTRARKREMETLQQLIVRT